MLLAVHALLVRARLPSPPQTLTRARAAPSAHRRPIWTAIGTSVLCPAAAPSAHPARAAAHHRIRICPRCRLLRHASSAGHRRLVSGWANPGRCVLGWNKGLTSGLGRHRSRTKGGSSHRLPGWRCVSASPTPQGHKGMRPRSLIVPARTPLRRPERQPERTSASAACRGGRLAGPPWRCARAVRSRGVVTTSLYSRIYARYPAPPPL